MTTSGTIVWKAGLRSRIDAAAAYREIAGRDHVTPEDLVDLARDEESVWHAGFEWNDQIAAEMHRRHRAGIYLASFEIVREDGDREPVYVHVRTEDLSAYRPMRAVVRQDGGLELGLAEVRRVLLGAAETVRKIERAAIEERHPKARAISRLARSVSRVSDQVAAI